MCLRRCYFAKYFCALFCFYFAKCFCCTSHLNLCVYFAKTFFCVLVTNLPCFVIFLSVLIISLKTSFFTKKCPLVLCTVYVLRRTPRSTARARKNYLCGALAHIWCETDSHFFICHTVASEAPTALHIFFSPHTGAWPTAYIDTVPVGRKENGYNIFPGRAYLLPIYTQG